jgi:hypothetical protein
MFRLANRLREMTAMDFPIAHRAERFMLWVDAVGGFWVCLADEVTLGQPIRTEKVDIPILADISSRHARIRRDGEGYLIEAIREVRLDGRPVERMAALAHGSKIGLGERVRMADSCILGPHPCSHVVCPDWPQEVVVYRHDEELFCRTAGSWQIDGVRCKDRGRLTRNSRVEGEGFSLRLEEIAT